MRWPVHSLGSLIEADGGLLQTGPFGSQLKQAEYSTYGVPVIMPKDIEDGEVNVESVARVPEETAERLSRHRIRAEGIVLPRRGAITKRAFIRPHQEGWLCGTGCIKIEATGRRLWPRYLYYYLGGSDSINWLEKNAVGSTMLNLSAEIVSRFPLMCPDIEIQKRIADILSNYDELIENNRRRMALLELAAREIYEEWFVRLRFPGREYTKIINGVPHGWIEKHLGEIVEVRKGRNITKDSARHGSVPVVAGGLSPAYYHDTANTVGPVITISASGANAGYVDLYHEDIWASDCSYINVASPGKLFYLYLLIKSKQRQIFALQRGAAQPHVYPKDLKTLSFLAPNDTVLNSFQRLVEENFHQVRVLNEQNKLLIRARDLLLPRLMKGAMTG